MVSSSPRYPATPTAPENDRMGTWELKHGNEFTYNGRIMFLDTDNGFNLKNPWEERRLLHREPQGNIIWGKPSNQATNEGTSINRKTSECIICILYSPSLGSGGIR